MQAVVWKVVKEINDDLVILCLRRAVYSVTSALTAIFPTEFGYWLGYGWQSLPPVRYFYRNTVIISLINIF